jgi:hypothetical protein
MTIWPLVNSNALESIRERERILGSFCPVPNSTDANDIGRVIVRECMSIENTHVVGAVVLVRTAATGNLSQGLTVVNQSHLGTMLALERERYEQIGLAHQKVMEQLRQSDAYTSQEQREELILEENFNYPEDRVLDTSNIRRLRRRA